MADPFIIQTPAELTKVVKYIHSAYAQTRIIALYGDLGAGKTTLVKAMARSLDVIDDVSSPTFSLVNEYQTTNGTSVFHIDLYRLESLEEALDAGIGEYLHFGSYCFIEWPEIIEPLLPEDCLKIQLEALENSLRKVVIL